MVNHTIDCVRLAMSRNSGGGGVYFTCQSLSFHIYLWRMAQNYTFIYIKRNWTWRPKFCLGPRSVQFLLKKSNGSKKKKKESLLSRSVPSFSSKCLVCMWFTNTNMKTSSKPKQNTIYPWGNFWIWFDDKPRKSIMWQNNNQPNSERAY